MAGRDSRVTTLHQRKNQLVEHSQRMAQTLQENFFRTAKSTQNAILPQPFEKHKKEFDSMKEVKPEVKPDD